MGILVGSTHEFRGKAKAYRLSRSVESRHFRRPDPHQGLNNVLDDVLGRRSAGRYSDNAGIAHPFCIDFAAVGHKIARKSRVLSNFTQSIGVRAISGPNHDQDVRDPRQFPHGVLPILRRVTDVADFRPRDVAEAPMQGGDHAAGVVDAQRRLSDVGDRRVGGDGKIFHVLFISDQVQFTVDLPQRPFDFRMSGMTDEDHDSALSNVPSALNMHLGDQRTSRINGGKRSQLRFVLNFARHAMSAENRHRSLRHLVQSLDETYALRLERFDDMAIMNNLVAHVDWSAILRQRPLDDVDGADNPCAKPAWLGKNDLHMPTLSPKPRRVHHNRRYRAIPNPRAVTNSLTGPIRGNICPGKRLAVLVLLRPKMCKGLAGKVKI